MPNPNARLKKKKKSEVIMGRDFDPKNYSLIYIYVYTYF